MRNNRKFQDTVPLMQCSFCVEPNVGVSDLSVKLNHDDIHTNHKYRHGAPLVDSMKPSRHTSTI